MSLQNEIDAKSKEIHTDGYPMSIGEIINLYKLNEMEIQPEFQRLFRWTDLQKTKLIESILLGIPIPSIFVSQRENGIWDVIDGLQRLSTILEFVGELRNPVGGKYPPTSLLKTEYLPSLENKVWLNENDPDNSFTDAQRLTFKRSKIDVKIIKKESDQDTKYELFQRLNTGGTPLSQQEVRNCLMVMINRQFYEWLGQLAAYPAFQSCISISEKQTEEQYGLELVLRFFAYKNSSIEEIRNSVDLGKFLTDKMVEYASEEEFNMQQEEEVFKRTFDLLDRVTSDLSFKKYDDGKGRFLGPFLISAFEVIAIGVGANIDNLSSLENEEILSKIKSVWQNETFKANSGSGSNAKNRLPHLLPLGKDWFQI